jgi:hypothetical protein
MYGYGGNPGADAYRSMSQYATGGGFMDGMNNAMQQMMLMNLANQRASIDTRAINAPIQQEQIRADSLDNLTNKKYETLGPLLQALAGSVGTAFGNSGPSGFQALGADGQPFASVTQGGSNAQPTNTRPTSTTPGAAPAQRGFSQGGGGIGRYKAKR